MSKKEILKEKINKLWIDFKYDWELYLQGGIMLIISILCLVVLMIVLFAPSIPRTIIFEDGQVYKHTTKYHVDDNCVKFWDENNNRVVRCGKSFRVIREK